MFLPSTFVQAQRRVSVRLGEKQRTEIKPPVCWGISKGETMVPDLFNERALQYEKWRTNLIDFFLDAHQTARHAVLCIAGWQ